LKNDGTIPPVVRFGQSMSQPIAEEAFMGRGTTTENNRIRTWIEARGGHPARIGDAKDAETVRVDFNTTKPQEQISWDEFFQGLDDSRLAFLHRTKAQDDVARLGRIVRRQRRPR
jgi:hypothetical protein